MKRDYFQWASFRIRGKTIENNLILPHFNQAHFFKPNYGISYFALWADKNNFKEFFFLD